MEAIMEERIKYGPADERVEVVVEGTGDIVLHHTYAARGSRARKRYDQLALSPQEAHDLGCALIRAGLRAAMQP